MTDTPTIQVEHGYYLGSGVEFVQSQVQRRGFCELLHRVANHVTHVCWMEVVEENEAGKIGRYGFRN